MTFLINRDHLCVRWCDKYIGGFPWVTVWRRRRLGTYNVALWRLHIGWRFT